MDFLHEQGTIALTYTCPCGIAHLADAAAEAVWPEELLHYCAACGRENIVQSGHVRNIPRQRRSAWRRGEGSEL